MDRPKAGPLSIDNNLIDDPLTMTNTFVNSFASVYVNQPFDHLSAHQTCSNNTSSVDFNASEIDYQLKSLKMNSAMGPDNTHPRLLKVFLSASSSLLYSF